MSLVMSASDSLPLAWVKPQHFTNFIRCISNCAHVCYSSIDPPFFLSRVLSTAVTTPSAAAKTVFTFTGVPSFSRPGCMPALWCPRHQELVDTFIFSMQYFHFRHNGSTMFCLLQHLNVTLIEQMNGAFSKPSTSEVCLLHCSCVSMLGSIFSNGTFCSAFLAI